jgi:hypothetical protein
VSNPRPSDLPLPTLNDSVEVAPPVTDSAIINPATGRPFTAAQVAAFQEEHQEIDNPEQAASNEADVQCGGTDCGESVQTTFKDDSSVPYYSDPSRFRTAISEGAAVFYWTTIVVLIEVALFWRYGWGGVLPTIGLIPLWATITDQILDNGVSAGLACILFFGLIAAVFWIFGITIGVVVLLCLGVIGAFAFASALMHDVGGLLNSWLFRGRR